MRTLVSTQATAITASGQMLLLPIGKDQMEKDVNVWEQNNF